jgi:hypothetical protein
MEEQTANNLWSIPLKTHSRDQSEKNMTGILESFNKRKTSSLVELGEQEGFLGGIH